VRLRGFVWLGLAVSVAACSDDTTGPSDSLGDLGETGTGDEDPTSTGDGDPSTTGDGDGDPSTGDGDGDPSTGDGDGDGDPTTGDGDGDPPPPFVPFDQSQWARGDIRVDRVEVNQGVAIEVVRDGQLIPVEQRTAGLVKERNALVQAYWAVPGSWQARPILARLHLRNTAGQLDSIDVVKTISGAPSSGSLTGPITWQLPAGVFQANTEFFIELREAEEAGSIPASSLSPSAPAGGMAPLGVPPDPMEAKLVLVPVKYNYGNCNTDTTAALTNNFDAFANHFFVQNPVAELQIEIHPTGLTQSTQVTTLSQINNALVGLRFNDFAEPNEYYYGLIDACSGGVDGAAGLAPGLPGPIKGAGDLRVSSGVWTGINSSRETFVHELGHNQGRPHSPCGGPDGADPNYPHDNAVIGVWGFDILTGAWKSPTTRDYMSYCGPTWVSDWTWGFVHEQVRQLTSWDYAGGSARDGLDDMPEILHGWVHPSGLEGWWTSPGELPEELLTTAESVAFYDDDGQLIDELPAASWVLEDGKTRYFMSEVPDSDLELVADIVRVSKDVEDLVPRHTVTRYFAR
jgi:hypothetical protein